MGRDRGGALAGCHVARRRDACVGGIDAEVGRVEGARWGGGVSGRRVVKEGGRACAAGRGVTIRRPALV